MTTTLPSVSCILPTYNRCDVVERTLEHLLAVDYPSDRFEIIVADNSTDGTPEMVERVSRGARAPVRLCASQHRLPAIKRNEALRMSDADLVLFMNDDLWVTPSFLQEHAATHARHDEPVAVVGFVEQSPQMPPTPFIQWYRPFAYDEIADRADRPVPYRYFWSMNLSLPRREMIERDLVFHEDWAEIGHEDVELGWRWTQAGRQVIYNPRARGEHYHPHDLASACRLQESIGRGLRDLEVLVGDPDLLERYGVFHWRAAPRAVVRGLARRAIVNRVTVEPIRAWIEAADTERRIHRWLYWKVMLHYTNRGYRASTPRSPRPLVTLPAAGSGRP